MVKVLFVCHGNICRSPMAELIFKQMVRVKGVALSFDITSRGTSDDDLDCPIYPPAAHVLRTHGIEGTHTSKLLTKRDIINADYVLVMDSENLFDVLRLTSGECGEKIFKLLSFTHSTGDVADPWWTRDFEKAFNDIYAGCSAFLNFLLTERSEMFDYDKRH